MNRNWRWITYDFLSQLGYTVYAPPFWASGKLLHVRGFLQSFRTQVQKNASYLRSLEALGMPMIGIEPSIVLTYRDEYEQFGDAKQAPLRVQLLQESLGGAVRSHSQRFPNTIRITPCFP